MAAGKGSEKLFVQVIAVGENDQRWIIHRRFKNNATRVEGHGEALAGTQRMPHDTDLPVTLGRCGRHRGADGTLHGVELVAARHLLDKIPTAIGLAATGAWPADETTGRTTRFLIEPGRGRRRGSAWRGQCGAGSLAPPRRENCGGWRSLEKKIISTLI